MPESSDDRGPGHLPVMRDEAMHFLAPERGGCYVDCTLGLGGHTEALLERFPDIAVIGIDRDTEALEIAGRRLAPFGDRLRRVAAEFGDLERTVTALGVERVSGVLADLGVSSRQLGVPERGFSFTLEGPLDMRMGPGEVTAKTILNEYPEEALANIFWQYGEERHSRRIAHRIVERRRETPFETTADLRQLVERVKPSTRMRPAGGRAGAKASAKRRRKHGSGSRQIHPATQVFQALRIEVNQELHQLRQLLDQSVRMLEPAGHLVVISYHSLEDRMVKNHFRDLAHGEVEPITGQTRTETQVIETLTKKPVRPSSDEVALNPRSRSARLRAARRL